MNYSHFSIQSMKEFLGDRWELIERPKEFNFTTRVSICSTIAVEQFSIPDLTKAFRELFLSNPFVIGEICTLENNIKTLQDVIRQREERIKYLEQFEAYYKLHKEMKHGNKEELTKTT